MGWKRFAVVLLVLSLIFQSAPAGAMAMHDHSGCPGKAVAVQAAMAADCCDEQAPERHGSAPSAGCGGMAAVSDATPSSSSSSSACGGDCAEAAPAAALPAMELPPGPAAAFVLPSVEPPSLLSAPSRRRDRPPRV